MVSKWALARAKGVTLITFISPEHAVLLETIDRLGAWPVYQAWKRRLVELLTALDVPLWDFSGYNDYTTTALQEGYRSFFDGSHFRCAVLNSMARKAREIAVFEDNERAQATLASIGDGVLEREIGNGQIE